jgi:hypothetical protein
MSADKNKKQTFLQKCLLAIKEKGTAKILISRDEKHHVLILSNSSINDHIICTTKQAEKLIPFSIDKELIPTLGYKYHFNKSNLK